MSNGTKIEWTDETWNPVTGCSVVSPGCTNCYAMRLAGGRLQHHPSRKGLTVPGKAGPVWTGDVRFNEKWLDQPLRLGRPRRIFVCAHGDLFHENVPDDWIDRVFAVMALAQQHSFQVLTKRPARMRAYFSGFSETAPRGIRCPRTNHVLNIADRIARHNYRRHFSRLSAALKGGYFTWPLPNVWLGVSAEDQTRADERIPDLLATPAAVRFVSCEPLLGPVWLMDSCNGHYFENFLTGRRWHDGRHLVNASSAGPRIDWIIAGGESGPGARGMAAEWAAGLRDQCAAAGVPFFMKQMAHKAPIPDALLVRQYPAGVPA